MARNIDSFSDEELAKMTPEQFAAAAGGDVDADSNENVEDAETGNSGSAEDANSEEESSSTTSEAASDEDGEKEQGEEANGAEAGEGGDAETDEADAGAESDKAAAAKGTKDAKGESADAKPAGTAPATPADGDLKAFFAKVTAPFKANGRDMQVASAEEAIQLMQMGANYNRKMAALKPKLAMSRMLDNAGLNEEQLSFLIDVHKKDPAAINKLVKDSGIDPMDLSAEKAADYRPNDHRVSEQEVELDQVLDELKDSPRYADTLDIVSKKWDNASKGIVAANPQVLKVLNTHLENGVYPLITAELERERAFGRLSGLSDLEAYRQVGDAMNARGAFDHLGAGQPPKGQQATPAQVIAAPNPKKADDSKRNDKKRAAMPAKGAAPSAGRDPNFNPLALSDEEFAKFKPNF